MKTPIKTGSVHAKVPVLLLICGILSSVLYMVANIVTAMLYDGYNSISQTVSEISAIDTPTRPLWVKMMVAYSILVIAFAFTFITVPIMIAIIAFGAAALNKGFRIYSIITLVILLTAGIITGIEGPDISRNLPTPFIGLWERINIGAYMLWIIVFALKIMRMRNVVLTKHIPVVERSVDRV